MVGGEVKAAQLPLDIPQSEAAKRKQANQLNIDTSSLSVNRNGCFELDRVIKSGYVEKRAQKTKKWKTIFIVLRPTTLSMYKDDKESKLRHQIHLSDLSAVTYLKDPKNKRQHVFGLFSASRNFHLQAPTAQDAQEWVELIRRDARIEEEQEDMYLASPLARSLSPGGLLAVLPESLRNPAQSRPRMLSSSPETLDPPAPGFLGIGPRRESYVADSSGLSGNELPSQSDFSDSDTQRIRGASMESVHVPLPVIGSLPGAGIQYRHNTTDRIGSQVNINNSSTEPDPDRVIWQGWLWLMKSKGGVRQWKNMWGVLRPRNMIMYKDESEYLAQWIVQLPSIVDIVDVDPVSKGKDNCFQIITEEKSFKFCAHNEESLVQFVGALKSLLAKRKGMETRGGGMIYS